jgi:hypothetical protein
MMNGTSAYLFFNRNRLRYVIFQIIGSYIAATQFTNTFRAVASELLGQPEKLNYTQLPSTVMGITGYEPFHLQFVWRTEGESLVSEIGQSGKNAFVHWQISVEGTDMQEVMMAFIRVQKCMDLILCGKLKQNGEVVDQDAAAVTFRHIISEATVPEEQRQTVNHYIEALRGDPEVQRVFGHATRVKTMMMAKTGQLTQGFRYQMHLKALGLPVESERQDVISPTEFFSLVGEFETYAQPFRDAIASDPDTMARIRKNYEDGS